MSKIHWRLLAGFLALAVPHVMISQQKNELKPAFHTSDRCLACHNGLTTPSGKDVSIGFDWRSSIMANSARDPYWQASVRREDIDHPESKAEIEDSCADCHMPMSRFEAKQRGELGSVFGHLPFNADPKRNAFAEDGVTCSVCHQISKERLGTRPSFNGGFAVDPPASKNDRPEFGPYLIQNGLAHVMQTSTGGFRPTFAEHISDSALCATCHTLFTKTLAPGGKEVGELPEQMPYPEWLHSNYAGERSCQSCHMPEASEQAPIAAVLGPLRTGVRLHTFVGANFFLLRLLDQHRDELSVSALPAELSAEASKVSDFLQSQAAKVTIQNVNLASGRLEADVNVQNLTGHKLPTAFPSRRAWLHVRVTDAEGRVVFESGALNPDGSILGNDNDDDPAKFEPHYTKITSSDQVEIYEDIIVDTEGHVTTGLSAGKGYIKDNRLLPAGFDKATAPTDIAVVGEALTDPNFTGGSDTVRYSVALGNARRPFHIQAELWYQPIGYRWAHNLGPYHAMEPQRFLGYFESVPVSSAIVLTRAEVSH